MTINSDKQPEIRFVYFDLGNLLVSFDRDRASDNLADLFGGTREVADDVMHASGLQNRLETGLISEDEFAQAIRDAYATIIDPAEHVSNGPVATGDVMRAISDMFTPIESMTAVLAHLRDIGKPIGILSNTCAAHWNWVNGRDWPVMEGPFGVEVVSYEALSMKPDPVIYETAMHLARQHIAELQAESSGVEPLQPEQILFVDDREENVLAARSHGWNAEVCFGGPQAIDVLRRFGLDVPLAMGANAS